MKKLILFLVAALAALADPPGGTLTIASTSLTNNLQFLTYPGNTNHKDIVSGNEATLFGGATWTGAGAAGGATTAFSSTGSSDGAYWPQTSSIFGSSSHNWTVVVRAKITSWAGGWECVACIDQNLNAANNPYYTIALTRHSTDFDSPAAFFTSSAGFLEYATGPPAFYVTGGWHTYAMVRNGSSLSFYRDGAIVDSPSFANDVDLGFGDHQPVMLFNNAVGGGNGVSGTADVYAIWDRALSSTELGNVGSNPYQLVTSGGGGGGGATASRRRQSF